MANNNRMREINELQKFIGNYSKTLDTYHQYKASKWSEKFFDEHYSAIALHKAAKEHFDKLSLEKLTTIKTLQKEYAALAAENKKLYPEQKRAREKMIELQTTKQNVNTLLGEPGQPQKIHGRAAL